VSLVLLVVAVIDLIATVIMAIRVFFYPKPITRTTIAVSATLNIIAVIVLILCTLRLGAP